MTSPVRHVPCSEHNTRMRTRSGRFILIRKRFESTGPDSLRKYCESAFRRLIRRFLLFRDISETRFFRSTIFILHSNLMGMVVDVSGECAAPCVSAAPCVAGPALSTVSEYGLDRERFSADSISIRISICRFIAKVRFARQFVVFDYLVISRNSILITMMIIFISISFLCSHSCTHYGRRCVSALGTPRACQGSYAQHHT